MGSSTTSISEKETRFGSLSFRESSAEAEYNDLDDADENEEESEANDGGIEDDELRNLFSSSVPDVVDIVIKLGCNVSNGVYVWVLLR